MEEVVHAVALPRAASDKLYDTFREMWKLAGREITVYTNRECFVKWSSYDVSEQRRILKDLASRLDGPWKTAKSTPPPLWYLDSLLWRTEPIGERLLATSKAVNAKEAAKDAQTRRVAERVKQMLLKRGHGR